MKTLGLYFSGTGNSKYCVEEFMKAINEETHLSSIEDKNVISLIKEADSIIIGYPVYYSNLPLILKDFIKSNHQLWNNKQIFLIATQGMFSGDGSGYCARLLKEYGATITGGIHIKMPDNTIDVKALKKDTIKEQEIIEQAKTTAQKAAKLYMQGNAPKHGLNPASHILGLFGQRLWFSRMVKEYKDHPKINHDKCIGCNKCVSCCPMQNLSLNNNNKAIHTNKCTLCYRCVHTCPTQAIALLGKQVVHDQSTLIK
jgi:NAD-dependent dihydropyrimidine dehydrogenase PreA subunit/flavodoxin